VNITKALYNCCWNFISSNIIADGWNILFIDYFAWWKCLQISKKEAWMLIIMKIVMIYMGMLVN